MKFSKSVAAAVAVVVVLAVGVVGSLAPRKNASVWIVEPDALFGGFFFTVEANRAEYDGRPKLVLVCQRGKPPSIQLYLGAAPSSPPPLRGTWARFSIDGGPETSLELSYVQKDGWWLRDDQDTAFRNLVASIVSAREVRLTPPPHYAGGHPITWVMPTAEQSALKMREECSS